MLQAPTFAVINALATGGPQSGQFTSLATFYSRPGDPSEVTDQFGQVDLIHSTPVAGLEGIPCKFAPQSATPAESDTVRTAEQFDTKREWHLTLLGYYPAVQQRFLLSVDGGDLYQIMAAESDSENTMTRCAVRRYGL